LTSLASRLAPLLLGVLLSLGSVEAGESAFLVAEETIGGYPVSVIRQMLIDQKIGRLQNKGPGFQAQHALPEAQGLMGNPANLPFLSRRDSLKQDLSRMTAPQPKQNVFDRMGQVIMDIMRRKRIREAIEAQVKVERLQKQKLTTLQDTKTGDKTLRLRDPKPKVYSL